MVVKINPAYRIVLPTGFEGLDVWAVCFAHGLAATDWPVDFRYVGQLRHFRSIRCGDWIVAYLRKKLIGGIGIATQEYDEATALARPPDRDYFQGRFWHRIGVAWVALDICIDQLPKPAQNPFRTPLTLLKISPQTFASVLDALDAESREAIDNLAVI